jgi:hypothetical protein
LNGTRNRTRVGGLLATLIAAIFAVALLPAAAFAVGGEQSLDEPPQMGYTTMKVTGEVKADLGVFSFVQFEISEDGVNFVGTGFNTYVVDAGEDVEPVEHTFTDLKPNTTYYARIRVERFQEPTGYSNVVSGTTLFVPVPDAISIDPASEVSFSSAHVSGEVEGVEGPDPAFETSCRFEYVSDAEFGARDETQELSVRAGGGTFVLYYGGQPTEPIAYNASAGTVEAALEALPNIAPGDVAVSGGPGDASGTAPYAIAFGGALAGQDVEQIFADGSGLTPTGGSGADVATTVGGHGVEGFNRASATPCDINPVGAGTHPVEADLSGLEAGTTYHLRLTVSNKAGSDSVVASNFTTLAVAPPNVVSVNDATNVRYTQADVTGVVERPVGADPAFDASCRVEYVPAEQFLSSGFQFPSQADCVPNPVTTAGATPVTAHLTGLAVGTTYYYRLVASNAGGRDVQRGTNPFTTLVPGAPVVSIFPVDQIGAHTAHFSGQINPGETDPGFDVNWRFECEPVCPGLEGTIPADEADHQISVTATGLMANTEYKVTLVAANAGAQASAGPVQFTTAAAGPGVVTFPAFALVGGTEALVGGTVDAENSATTYWIEYGSDDSYGSSLPLTEDADAGSGDSADFVTQKLTGLQPGATYHYRLVAENVAGTTAGLDRTFTTPTGSLGSSIGTGQLPDGRAWEMVSPPDKNNADIWKANGVAAADGEAVAFKSQGSFAGAVNAKGGTLNDYMAERGSGGWSTKGLTPAGGLFCFVCAPQEFSEELDIARYHWRENAKESPDPELPVNPNAKASATREYLRDNVTDRFKILPNGSAFASSADGSHYLIQSEEKLDPDAPCLKTGKIGNGNCVYETLDKGFTWQLVSRLTDESGAHGTLIGVSRDGSHAYFSSEGKLFVRVDGASTTEIAPSGSVVGIEGPGGNRALVTSGEGLVAADQDGGLTDLYLWDESKPETERWTLLSAGDQTGVETEFGGVLGYAQDQLSVHDLDYGFFTASNQILAGQPDAPGQKIYAWSLDGGQVTVSYVATADQTVVRVSPNGRFLAFASSNRLTAYDNGAHQEIYRYDGQTDQLVCVSCDPVGRAQSTDATFIFITGTEETFDNGHVERNLTDDGRVFFQSSEGLVPRDANGMLDVYEYEDGLPYLISRGSGSQASRFVDASADGRDAFFVTSDQLVGWDVDHAYDVYDARVGGGLPEPPPGIVGCEGDACQPAPVPPNDPTPASESYNGVGNVKPPLKKKPRKHKRHHKKKHGKHGKHGKKKQKAPKTTRKNG